jgi:uncharacterized Zn-finger protein
LKGYFTDVKYKCTPKPECSSIVNQLSSQVRHLTPSYQININHMAPKFILLLGAAISLVNAQSSDPGIGTNPNAQGATEDVTPGSGPNGYFAPIPLCYKPFLINYFISDQKTGSIPDSPPVAGTRHFSTSPPCITSTARSFMAVSEQHVRSTIVTSRVQEMDTELIRRFWRSLRCRRVVAMRMLGGQRPG